VTYVALVGVTLILVRGAIFARLRALWPALLECTMCTGTWVGIAAGASGIVTVAEVPGPVFLAHATRALLAGCAVSVLSLLTDAVLLKLLGDPDE